MLRAWVWGLEKPGFQLSLAPPLSSYVIWIKLLQLSELQSCDLHNGDNNSTSLRGCEESTKLRV